MANAKQVEKIKKDLVEHVESMGRRMMLLRIDLFVFEQKYLVLMFEKSCLDLKMSINNLI